MLSTQDNVYLLECLSGMSLSSWKVFRVRERIYVFVD